MAGHGESPLSHVIDHSTLELPHLKFPYVLEIELPRIAGLQITRFMVTEVIAALLVVLVIVPLARHVARQHVTRGWFLNMFEAMILFIRDKVARPAIGGHGADDYLPYLWTVFFFVLFNNLLGMIPGMASATGNINVTGVLAFMTLATVIAAGVRQMGAVGFWVNIVPHMDVPPYLKIFLWPLMFVIEVAGLLIRHTVLAVRLFANMLAGHIVLAVILGFILMARALPWPAWAGIATVSVAGVIALSLLELFVAFLQAYIFTFLSALFIGSAVHPH
jgi:F-type H+-transporting ATPase subunit a